MAGQSRLCREQTARSLQVTAPKSVLPARPDSSASKRVLAPLVLGGTAGVPSVVPHELSGDEYLPCICAAGRAKTDKIHAACDGIAVAVTAVPEDRVLAGRLLRSHEGLDVTPDQVVDTKVDAACRCD